jgi:hypothetical protein
LFVYLRALKRNYVPFLEAVLGLVFVVERSCLDKLRALKRNYVPFWKKFLVFAIERSCLDNLRALKRNYSLSQKDEV